MNALDDLKDKLIKEKLQQDKLISKKADMVFNDFLKGDFKMENENINVNTKKPKKNVIFTKVLATAVCLVILFTAGNVYATKQGYENIFFMIKYLVTGETKEVTNKEEILSDRDIAISYEPINITENISVIIKKIQITNESAKLNLIVSEEPLEEDGDIVPLRYKVYNTSNGVLCNQKSAKDGANNSSYSEELILNNYKNENILKLEIYQSNSELLTTIEIDLENREIKVLGEEEALKKISEIELKKFLGHVGGLTDKHSYITDDELKIFTAINIGIINDIYTTDISGIVAYKVEDVNEILEEFCGEKITDFKDGNVFINAKQKGIEYFRFAEAGDMSIGAECINIDDISYSNGIYTVTYTFFYPSEDPENERSISTYDIYQQTVKLKINEDGKYTKFTIISMEDKVLLQEAQTDENETEEIKINTSADNTTNNTDIIENNTTSDSNTNVSDITNNSNTTVGNTTSNSNNTIGNTTSNSNTTVGNTTSNSNTTVNNTTNNTNTTVSNPNTSNTSESVERVDNYASTMSWKQYWAPGLKFSYPEIFDIKTYGNGTSQGELSTAISGIAKGINKETGEIIESEIMIEIYEPEYMPTITAEEYFRIKTNGGIAGAATTTSTGTKWYEKTNVDGETGVKTRIFTHYEGDWGYKIIINSTNDIPTETSVGNYKVLNIVNWLMGSTKITSY